MPDPGWYQDPSGEAPFRWWDGRQWTGYTSSGEPSPPVDTNESEFWAPPNSSMQEEEHHPSADEPEKKKSGNGCAIIFLAVIILWFLGTVMGGGGSSEQSSKQWIAENPGFARDLKEAETINSWLLGGAEIAESTGNTAILLDTCRDLQNWVDRVENKYDFPSSTWKKWLNDTRNASSACLDNDFAGMTRYLTRANNQLATLADEIK